MSQRVLARALNYMISPCLYWASPPWTAVPRWKCPSRPLPSSNLVLSEGHGNYWDKYRREGETCGKNTLIIHSLLIWEMLGHWETIGTNIGGTHLWLFILFHWIKISHNWHKLFFHVIVDEKHWNHWKHIPTYQINPIRWGGLEISSGTGGGTFSTPTSKMVPTSKYANFAFLFNSRQGLVNCPSIQSLLLRDSAVHRSKAE